MGVKPSKLEEDSSEVHPRLKREASATSRTVRKLSTVLRRPSRKHYLTAPRLNQTIRPCGDGCESQGLMVATERGHRACVMKLLSSGSSPMDESENGEIPFHRAVRHPDILEMFLEFGCDVNTRLACSVTVNRDATASSIPAGRTALHFAAEQGNLASIRMLLGYGAHPDPKDSSNLTPLLLACEGDYKECTRRILKACLKYLNKNCKWLHQTLMQACVMGDVLLVKLLCEGGADLCEVDIYDGLTPLMVASKAGRSKVVTFLLDHHVETMCKDKLRKWTAVDYALAHGHEDCAQILQDYTDGSPHNKQRKSIKKELATNSTSETSVKCDVEHPEVQHTIEVEISDKDDIGR